MTDESGRALREPALLASLPEPASGLVPTGDDPARGATTHEDRMKLAAELTLQRRIHEHARDRARRELDFAEAELVRITDAFMRHVVEPSVTATTQAPPSPDKSA